MMDIKGTGSSGGGNVTSLLLARIAVDKNHENRELIKEPAKTDVEQEASKAENSSDKSTVAPVDASDTNTNAQITGRVVNVNV